MRRRGLIVFFAVVLPAAGCGGDSPPTYPGDAIEVSMRCLSDDDCTDSGRFPDLVCADGFCIEGGSIEATN